MLEKRHAICLTGPRTFPVDAELRPVIALSGNTCSGPFSPEKLADQGKRSLRIRSFPSLYLRTRHNRVPAEYATILAALGDTYRTIVRDTGCDVIIDSSKYPSVALLAGLIPGVELHVVHVVRSPHSVVASWTRKNGYLAVHPPGLVVSLWWAYNVLSEALKSRAKTYRLVRYEDFARNPGLVLQQITTDVMWPSPAHGTFSRARKRPCTYSIRWQVIPASSIPARSRFGTRTALIPAAGC